MTIPTWRTAAALALALGVLAPCRAGAPGPATGDRDLATWVDGRVRAWQPTAEELRLDDIGWAKDIRTAERLARDHGRAVFLFTYDGDSLAHYRC
ncbi:MAG TPA: hypothetical protein VJ739_07200 [Gemmataceae bacterium]|nr:hypothetical protein [Gemmataceae bacterium]